MKPPPRLLVLLALLTGGGGLIGLLVLQGPAPPLRPSLAPTARLLGTPFQLADRLASRMVPVGELDERELGTMLHARYARRIQPGDADQAYLDALMELLSPHRHRNLHYRAYAVGPCGGINASALPGGVVLVCRELLEEMTTEAEVVAVLAHEIGHLELGHCFELVRSELLARRTGTVLLGRLADQILTILVRRRYSQAAESESDAYAFALLTDSPYDPSALAGSFRILVAGQGRRRPVGLLGDLSRSHPPSELRQHLYEQRSRSWWRGHTGERRYRGARNLSERRTRLQRDHPEEWVEAER
ncbi:M48 family metallopeptidase [Cyanobium sp. NIES-981]|uniref:M48 family metallopeptidase n=1 Tax=Cyanobium sp. NIES-981 TaxID=1851505 RepID=UPI0007DD3F5D|nr:M48 family metallopeptidase [Cyanobium sp. NIES-981]SBO42907.1 Peptidase M48, Ste24p [Cyanobium sp. NIES-981]